MAFRLDPIKFPDRAKIQFTTSAEMPHLIYKACLATETVSNTVYCQRAVCEALSRDLGIPIEELLANLPAPRGPSKHVFDPAEGRMDRYRPIVDDSSCGVALIGPANTIEDVR